MRTEKITRKPYESDLTDKQWAIINPLLPAPARTGRPRGNLREVINGILYVLKTGCKWKDMPHDIDASPSTCNRILLTYQKKQVWQKIVRELMKKAYAKGKINLNNGYHDASVVKSKRGLNNK